MPAGRATGSLVLLVGLGHIVLAGVLFADQLGDLVSDGLVAAVRFDDRASEEAAAIWFTVNGVLLVMVGQLARAHERLVGKLPSSPGWVLAALGAVGAAVAPVSGFWVYIALGALWVRESR
jgi:pheromone shutdown protein TraB